MAGPGRWATGLGRGRNRSMIRRGERGVQWPAQPLVFLALLVEHPSSPTSRQMARRWRRG